MLSMAYTPQTFRKGDRTAVANFRDEEVDLLFDGWLPTGPAPIEDSHRVTAAEAVQASLTALAAELIFEPQGRWDFAFAPTVNGVALGSGGTGGTTTSASALTSGTLAAARIADASLPFSKMSGQITDAQIPTEIARDSEVALKYTKPAGGIPASDLAAGTIPAAYTDEQAEDVAAGLLTNGTHTGVSFTYDDVNRKVNATVSGGGAAGSVTSSNITDATAVGRSVLTAADAAAARTAIGAGTSNLALGTTSTTAKAGDYTPPSDAVAGTASMRTLGTGAQQAAAGNDARLSDARTPTTHTHPAAQVSDATAVGRSVMVAVDAAAARTAIGAGTSSLVLGTAAGTAKAGNYAPPSDSIATTASLRTLGTGAQQAAPGTHTHVKADVGLGNVDNTSDATKPVSTPQADALSAKAATEGLMTHDGTATGGTRPTGYARIRWVGGTTRPTNMVTGDIWEHDA